jgi:hypothetical protein
MIAHVVLISFQPETVQSERETALSSLRNLGDACGGRSAGIVCWQADWNLDQRKNYHLMLVSRFESEASYRRYASHPEHRRFADNLSKMADWVSGDIEVSG